MPCQHDHITIGKDHRSTPVHYAQPVAITVEPDAERRAMLAYRRDQVLQIGLFQWVGVVVGKPAVWLKIKRDHVAANRLEATQPERASRAVAAIEHNLDRPVELEMTRDILHVCLGDVELLVAARAACEIAAIGDSLNLLDLLAGERLTTIALVGLAQLETVELGRVMASRYHRAAIGVEVGHSKVHQGCWRHPNVYHIAAGAAQTSDQRGGVGRR